MTDELGIIATALGTVPSSGLMAYLKEYASGHVIDCFVVGDPRRLDNSPSESAPYTDAFVRNLAREFPGKRIERMDERFTSRIASRAILESGISKTARRDKGLVDSVSAVLILQEFMEKESSINQRNRP